MFRAQEHQLVRIIRLKTYFVRVETFDELNPGKRPIAREAITTVGTILC